MKHLRNPSAQISDALVTMAFLTLSGGFQDAYTFYERGQVFANAQTGNMVLLSEHLFQGDPAGAVRYLVPVLAFALGVWVTERVRLRYRHVRALHWRQWVVLAEALILSLVGFLPQESNALANALVSFTCALQVQAFRKVNGHAFASTMCIGNLRSGVEAMDAYLRTRNRALLKTAGNYLFVLLCFVLGAGLGSVLSPRLGVRAIWLSCAWLAVSFGLMSLPGAAGDPGREPPAAG